jgi:adenosylmethionine-8-amino-7-oxononanoate aminotransferase
MVRHGQTYSGHAAVCAAALANIDILEREGLIPRGAELEEELLSTLAPLAEHPLVGEVRGGTGFLCGVAFDRVALAEDPALPVKAYKAIMPHGVILRALGGALAVSPPLTISSDEIQLIHDAVRAGLDSLVESRTVAA